MKKIYIVLTYTGTALSRLIRFYTGKRYSHVSLALQEDLRVMYSFGRLNPYNPFIGGFVKEGIEVGTFKRFKNTDTLVYSVEITEEQYNQINENIKKFIYEKEKYKFNTIGLFLAGFDKKIERENYFYCAEFVKYVLDNSKVDFQLPNVIKPDDFTKISNKTLIYQGKLKDFIVYNKVVINV